MRALAGRAEAVAPDCVLRNPAARAVAECLLKEATAFRLSMSPPQGG
jgi:hypothetical protein